MDPFKDGAPQRHFTGLEVPPVVTTGLPGRHFVLKARRLGSLEIGTPVYYRQIKVGQVVGYKLQKDGKTLSIRVFVNAPLHELVRENTRFWNAGGLDVKLDAEGIQVRTESLVSLMLGGIAFDVPADEKPGDPAPEDHLFSLYEKYEDIYEVVTTEMNYYMLQFDGSVRGLAKEAPVEFRGIKIGEVTDIRAQFELETLTPRILVFIRTDPGVWEITGEGRLGDKEQMEVLVAKGLRAQLKTGSMLTGQLFVDIDFHPNAPLASVGYDGIYPQIPTVPAPFEMITASLNHILNKLEKLPVEEIGSSLKKTVQGVDRLVNSTELQGAVVELNKTLRYARKFAGNLDTSVTPELQKAVARLNETLKHTQGLAQKLNSKVTPEISATLQQGQRTLADLGGVVDPDSPLYQELKRALRELGDAAKSIRVMADYLERHPDALIYGKGK
jgi:paraquat-inducible protein B